MTKDEKHIDLSRRQMLGSLGAIGVASASAGLGTSAYFNDEELFSGNSLTAGQLDLSVDYWTSVDQGAATGETGGITGSGTIQGDPVAGDYAIEDVKPGDSGTLVFCPKVVDNPAWVLVRSDGVTDFENGQTEPEGDVDDTGGDPGEGNGELSENVPVTVSYCEPADGVERPEGTDDFETIRELDNPEGYTLADLGRDLQSGFVLDGSDVHDGETDPSPASEDGGDQQGPCICIEWEVPAGVGNEIQTDSVEFGVEFYAEQERHNDESGDEVLTPEVGEITTVKPQSTDSVPALDGSDDVTPPEGYPVPEEEFERIKEQARKGELAQPGGEDPVEEEAVDAVSTSASSSITIEESFDAWDRTDISTVPDCNLAVGDEHVLLTVNSRWGIYDKDGNRGFQVTLRDWFDPVHDDPSKIFDPKALYDHREDRFVLMALAKYNSDNTGSWLVAVSDDGSPYGTWQLAEIPHSEDGEWVDYPGLGLNDNGIYLTGDIIEFGGTFEYSTVVSIDKTPFYDGNTFTYWWWDDVRHPGGTDVHHIQPAHQLGTEDTQYLVNSKWKEGSNLTLWEMTNPTSNPRLRRQNVSVNSYSTPPNARQPDTSQRLDTTDARLMNAVFDDGSLWTAHSISYTWPEDDEASAVLKWYEIGVENGVVEQSRGFGRPGADYYFPTIATTGLSTMLVYNESDADSVYPRIEVAGRTATHTSNSLEDVRVLRDGGGSYDFGSGTRRWGDYSLIGVDPSFESFWAFSEYGTEDDFTAWGTHVGEVSIFEELG